MRHRQPDGDELHVQREYGALRRRRDAQRDELQPEHYELHPVVEHNYPPDKQEKATLTVLEQG